jgi:hypothetical protein
MRSAEGELEATTGAGEGADLFYTIERGRGAKRRAPESGETLETRPAEAPSSGDAPARPSQRPGSPPRCPS